MKWKTEEQTKKTLEVYLPIKERQLDFVFSRKNRLDVLDAEQELLEEKVEVIKVKRDKFVTIFNLIAYMGKLSPSDLNLDVDVYSLDKNYLAVKNMWLGFED